MKVLAPNIFWRGFYLIKGGNVIENLCFWKTFKFKYHFDEKTNLSLTPPPLWKMQGNVETIGRIKKSQGLTSIEHAEGYDIVHITIPHDVFLIANNTTS